MSCSRQTIGRWMAMSIFTILIGCGGPEQPEKIMPESTTEGSQGTLGFHQIVENGSLEDLKRALQNGADVNAAGHVQQTALMVAIAVRDLEKMKLLIQHGADPELSDEFNATSLRHAVDWDFVDGVNFLLGLGVDKGYQPKYPLKKVNVGFELPEVKVPDELAEIISEEEWKASLEQTRESMSEFGQNPTAQPIISEVQSVEVLKLFLEAGDDLNLAPTEVKRAYIGLDNEGEFKSSLADYTEHRSPRFGTRNPEPMDNPFWRDMIRIGGNAYAARQHFNDTDPFSKPGAIWCYDRFGSTLTQLDDGRFVQIGGEHEDFYDPDFHIYNDVVVHDGRGNFKVYGYPDEVFPPTDFHSATLVGEHIYIIGCLGDPEQRQEGRTPIFRLKLESWEIEEVAASGEMPSWLHRHRAIFESKKNVIHVKGGERHVVGEDGGLKSIPNNDQFELDLSSFQWRRIN